MQTTPKTYVYKRVADCQIKADVHQPATGSTRVPVVMFIHGGGLIYGSRKGINPKQLASYLEAGYAVVSIDYRLAPESKLPEIIQDELSRHQVEHELITAPGSGHGFDHAMEEPFVKECFSKVLAFLAKHTRNEGGKTWNP